MNRMNHSLLNQVLDLARWAPSGDNTQPWRFELLDEHRFVIHGHDTRSHCVYDLDGHPSQVSIGALIETAAIAASAHGMALDARRRPGLPDTRPTFDVTLRPDRHMTPDPLISAIALRSVQRRPLSTRPLAEPELQALAAAAGAGHELVWLAGAANRWRCARLLWDNAGLRLRLPEAFETHRDVIQWNARYSDNRIPDQALGVDRLTRLLMRHALQKRERVEFLNTYLAGTVLPRVQMDLLPALRCAAHVAILAPAPPVGIDGHVAAGRAVQRFWLQATALGLQHQPEMTPLIFARYVREQRHFTDSRALQTEAAALAVRLAALLDGQQARCVWLGRIGHGTAALSRSERLSLHDLCVDGDSDRDTLRQRRET